MTQATPTLPPSQDLRLAPSGLPPDLRERLPRRLRTTAWISAALFLLLLAFEPFRPAAADGGWVVLAAAVAGAVFSLVMARLAAFVPPGSSRLDDVAFAFEVGVGLLLWVMEFSVPFAEATHTPGVPVVAAWLLFFPAIVPLTLRMAGTAAVVLTMAGPLVLLAFVVAGQPAPPVGHAFVWFVPVAFTGAASLVTASVIERAVSGVASARRRDAYELVERLGSGGMGDVFVARHARLARLAAVKRIRLDKLGASDRMAYDKLAARFEVEARITARLRSPHTVELYDFGVAEDGALYYAMELLEGIDLEELVSMYGPLPPARVVHFLLHACDSLAEAHEMQLVHRDIKPANLFVCRLGLRHDVVKVLDFGTVKLPPDQDAGEITQDDMFVGTPAYAAPEASAGSVEPRSDLYALGCVAWWLLTGSTVFGTDNVVDVIHAHRHQAPPPLEEATPLRVPAGLADVIYACLAKRPDDRPASARELASRLRALDVGTWTEDDAAKWWVANADAFATGGESLKGLRSVSMETLDTRAL